MPTKTLQIPGELNISLQPGDIIYASKIRGGQAGTNHPNSGNVDTKPVAIGKVTPQGIDFVNKTVTIETSGFASGPSGLSYVMFNKDNRVNTSGIVGYFAECELKNYSTKYAEVFVVATDFAESSK
tara:strand:- start:74 stop:451 length:378 start_codon:yes stop_codon:yes gene_type:complete